MVMEIRLFPYHCEQNLYQNVVIGHGNTIEIVEKLENQRCFRQVREYIALFRVHHYPACYLGRIVS